MFTPSTLPFWPTQTLIGPVSGTDCWAFAAGEILATNIAAADAPTSQRHAFLKD
jgi:hypothetical protein